MKQPNCFSCGGHLPECEDSGKYKVDEDGRCIRKEEADSDLRKFNSGHYDELTLEPMLMEYLKEKRREWIE